MCLERIEFDYIDLTTNESKFKREFKAPFEARGEFDLEDRLIPCNDNFDYVTRVGKLKVHFTLIANYTTQVIGKNGNQSLSQWTPQSCKKTTPAPSTTTTAAPTTTTMGDEEKAQAAEDNVNLKQELQDLKQQYHAIGETMYEVVKDNVYHGFEAYLARKKESLQFIIMKKSSWLGSKTYIWDILDELCKLGKQVLNEGRSVRIIMSDSDWQTISGFWRRWHQENTESGEI